MSSYTQEELAAIAAKREAKKASKRSRSLFEDLEPVAPFEPVAPRPSNVPTVAKTKESKPTVTKEPLKDPLGKEPSATGLWFLDFVEEGKPETVEAEGAWIQAMTFANKVQIDLSTRSASRQSYAKCLEDLRNHVQQWKAKTAPSKTDSGKTPGKTPGKTGSMSHPLMLIGEIGCGKTWLLHALANHLHMDIECLQDIFMDPPSSSVLEQLGTKGFSLRPKLWVVEHYDMLTPQWTAALKKTFPAMLKSGPIILTAWPCDKQKPEHSLELSAWTTESKLAFLRTQGFTEKSSKFLLQESGSEFGVSICGALECAKVWGRDLAKRASLEEGEESSAPPINLRLLLEESFTTRWSATRSLALETYDLELSLGIVQEMAVSASSVGKTDIDLLASQLDHLSAMDMAQRRCSDIASWFVHDRVIQQQTLKKAKASMSKFTSGTLVPLPQSLIQLAKKKSSLQMYQDALLKSRHMDTEATEHMRDTRTHADEVEVFMRASGLKWKSPFKKTE